MVIHGILSVIRVRIELLLASLPENMSQIKH